jgi:uncharacterized protein (TIGR02284 family)
METIEKTVEVLNDLIEINNDRIAGFAHAAKELSDGDLDVKAFFQTLREESRRNVQELGQIINDYGGETEMGFSASGTLHRMWLDVKATFSGHDRKSVLEECERGEDAIKKAYGQALTPENELPPEAATVIANQQAGIITAHNQIKTLRDQSA